MSYLSAGSENSLKVRGSHKSNSGRIYAARCGLEMEKGQFRAEDERKDSMSRSVLVFIVTCVKNNLVMSNFENLVVARARSPMLRLLRPSR